MRHRGLVVVGMLAAVTVLLASPVAAGQTTAGKGGSFEVGKTPWGDPDIQGIWNFGTITPLERPDAFADRERLTPEEVAALNSQSEVRAVNRPDDPERDVALAYNQFWWDRGVALDRSSLIVDPENGRLPPYTPQGLKRRQERDVRGYESYTSRSLNERCLVYRPVPVRSSGYNNNNMIVQSPGYVAMYQEQIHEVRIIPLDGRPHIGAAIRPWLGDSRGRWEGNTLVVETTNFHPESEYEGSGPNRKVIERFTPVDANTMLYEFTVDDPTTWTRAWTGQVPWRRDPGPIFEYACHEGNYGMVNLLNGARVQEKKDQTAQKGESK